MSASARLAAARTLLRIEKDGAWSSQALDGMLRREGLSGSRDAAFAARLVYGVLERKLTLDHCIAPLLRGNISPPVRTLLRLGVYQLLYMDSVPQAVAVNETVALAGQLGQSRAAGLINGVLRSFLRAGGALPPLPEGAAARFSVLYSCLPELAERLIAWYGEDEAQRFLAGTLGAPPLFLQVNTRRTCAEALLLRLRDEGRQAEPVDAYMLRLSGGAVAEGAAYSAGLYFVQDLSAHRAVAAVGLTAGERVLDLCAAPGGKSFAAALAVGETGSVLARDVSEKKLALVHAGAKRLGLSNIRTRPGDAREFDPTLGLFDAVLCDVPCSGLGVLRRRPEIKYRPPGTFDRLPDLQYNILIAAAGYVRPGGRLCYSTCTVDPAENRGVVQRFLAERRDYSLKLQEQTLLSPLGGDGFYHALLTKEAEAHAPVQNGA